MKQVRSMVSEISESFRKEPWFGDRLLMFGFLRPIAWQGRLVALGLIAGCIANGRIVGLHQALGIVILLAAIALYAMIAYLTSGKFWSWGILKSDTAEGASTTKE